MHYEKLILQIVLGIALVAIGWPFIQDGVKNFIAFVVLAMVLGGVLLGILEGVYASFKNPLRRSPLR